MLSLKEIKKEYPEKLQSFDRHILREYLQYKILEVIYSSKVGNKLIFMGGTALRIVYNNQRFSEDLDFDSKGISLEEFKKLSKEIKKQLERQGLEIEINPKETKNGAFVNELKVLNLLYKEGVSSHEGEKLTIKVDAADQEYDYEPNIYNLDKFDVYSKIKVAPMSLILAQKFFCLFGRNRIMARDLFDISFLIENKEVKCPDLDYLREKMPDLEGDNLSIIKNLKAKLNVERPWVNLRSGTADLRNLLMNPDEIIRISKFPGDLKYWDFGVDNMIKSKNKVSKNRVDDFVKEFQKKLKGRSSFMDLFEKYECIKKNNSKEREERFGIRLKIEEKGPFIEELGDKYLGWGEKYADGIIKGENKKIATTLNKELEEISKDKFKHILNSPESKEYVALVSGRSGASFEREVRKDFIYANNEGLLSLYGYYKNKLGYKVPVYSFQGIDSDFVFFVKKERMGKVVQYNPLDENESGEYKYGRFYIQVKDLKSEPELREQLKQNNLKKLKKARECYETIDDVLDRKVDIEIREKFEYDTSNLEGFKVKFNK